MQHISKKLIVAMVAVIIALVALGWFWYASVKEKQAQEQVQSEVQLEMEQQTDATNSQTTNEGVNISDWKTYRNDEYGVEFKYPSDSVVVVQPSTNKEYGTVFVITQSVYDDLQENSPIFKENPTVGLLNNGDGIEITWDRSPLIVGYFQSNGFEKAFKILLHDGDASSYPNGKPGQSSMIKTTATLSKVMNVESKNEMYAYELQLENMDTGSSHMRNGFIWEEHKSFSGDLQFINTNVLDDNLKNCAIQIVLSFEML